MAFNNVPVNGWPQIKDLEKLDAIAQQIQNMPTFTSNDKAFLEDLPAYPATDGKKALMATTTSGETSLSYEEIEDELPADPVSDGVRVLTATTTGGVTTLSYEEASSGTPDYSTTEQATGQKWIDGKDIYFKTVVPVEELTLTSQTWTATGESGAGISTILNAFGVDANGSYFTFNATPDVSSTGYIGFLQTRSQNITITKFVIFYTKTESEV